MLRRLRIENLVLIREAELTFAPGLNAVTGETGAGKTIFAQAIGLLLGARADASSVGSEGTEAYVEAELDVPDGFFEDEELAALAELRPEGEAGLVIARRVFGDGRTRAYAWGRAVAREDVAAAAERLIAMSGQFEQRRLARASFQLDVLDSFCGAEQAERRREAQLAWRELIASRRRYEELTRDAAAVAARLAELARPRRLRRREWRPATSRSSSRGASVSGTPRSSRRRQAPPPRRSRRTKVRAPLRSQPSRSARWRRSSESRPSSAATAEELRDLTVRLREAGSDLHRFVASLDAEPGALEGVEERLQAIADLRRRFAASSYDELLELSAAAERELDASADGGDPVESARQAVAQAEERTTSLARDLRAEREANAKRFGEAVADELASLGMGEGEFLVELREREPGPTGADEATFLIRPNAGLPFAPIADTASGGELSRVALALAAVAGGETLVFDEIDAGIGGVTAHAVAATLQRLAERAQVLTITHLPQIASVADTHFRVEKVPGDPTHTRIEELDELLRREEIERMAGGAEFIATLAEG